MRGDSAVEATRRQATAIRVLGQSQAAVTTARSTAVLPGVAALARLMAGAMVRVTALPKVGAMVLRRAVTVPVMAAHRAGAMVPVMVPPEAVAMVPVMVAHRVTAMALVMVPPEAVATVPAMAAHRAGAMDRVTVLPQVAAMAQAMADQGITAPMIEMGGMTLIGRPVAVGSTP